jgi:hypothetical protein
MGPEMGSIRCPPLKGVLDRSKKKGQGPLPFLRTENPWGKFISTIQAVTSVAYRGSRLVCLISSSTFRSLCTPHGRSASVKWGIEPWKRSIDPLHFYSMQVLIRSQMAEPEPFEIWSCRPCLAKL